MMVLWVLGFYLAELADLINWHMALYDVPFTWLHSTRMSSAECPFSIMRCHTPTSKNNRHRMRLWPAICSRRQGERDKTTHSRAGAHPWRGIQKAHDTHTHTVCQLAKAESIAFKKGHTTLLAPLTYSIRTPYIRHFHTHIHTHTIFVPLERKAKVFPTLTALCQYFVSISLGSSENCFDFYCLSALNPCAMHSKKADQLLCTVECMKCGPVGGELCIVFAINLSCSLYFFAESPLPIFCFLPFFFSAACFLGNLFHWTFVCLLGSPVNGMKRFVLLFSPPLRTRR